MTINYKLSSHISQVKFEVCQLCMSLTRYSENINLTNDLSFPLRDYDAEVKNYS